MKHKHVSAIVTTAGGIEEDFIKCLGKTYLADFNMDGADLRKRGLNRVGNLVIPNDNYCKFEDWFIPVLDIMLEEQKASSQVWTPSTFIRRLGKEINNEESVYYWAYKVNTMHLYELACPLRTRLIYIAPERHSGILPSSYRRFNRRYDLLSFLSISGVDR